MTVFILYSRIKCLHSALFDEKLVSYVSYKWTNLLLTFGEKDEYVAPNHEMALKPTTPSIYIPHQNGDRNKDYPQEMHEERGVEQDTSEQNQYMAAPPIMKFIDIEKKPRIKAE